jgi:peptide-methionine (S)-S-oxide reductase
VTSTLVGYAGGTSDAPTYRSIGDHSETVLVEFDPAVISYAALLEVFWAEHDPTAKPYLSQYRNAVFTTSEQQRQAAEASRRQLEERTGRVVNTAIEAAGIFTPAEDYHQKYYLQRVAPLMAELQQHYPDRRQLFRSTAAARLNGYLGCNGDPATFGADLRQVGLPANLERDLHDSLTTSCREFKGAGCALPPRL